MLRTPKKCATGYASQPIENCPHAEKQRIYNPILRPARRFDPTTGIPASTTTSARIKAYAGPPCTGSSRASNCRIFGICSRAAASPTAANSFARANSVRSKPVTSGSITTSAGCTPMAFRLWLWTTRLRRSVCTALGLAPGVVGPSGVILQNCFSTNSPLKKANLRLCLKSAGCKARETGQSRMFVETAEHSGKTLSLRKDWVMPKLLIIR